MACCAKHARSELAAWFHGYADGLMGFVRYVLHKGLGVIVGAEPEAEACPPRS